MAGGAWEDAREERPGLLLLVVFFVFLVIIIFKKVAIFPGLLLIFLVVLFVQIIRDDVQMDGMRLRNFHLGFAFGTTQDLAFLDFVFIHIDFGGTFRATDHGSILRRVVRAGAEPHRVPHRAAYYIPQPEKSTPGRAETALNATAPED
jgi:hypothetical protein